MSKKLIYFRIIIITVCLLFVGVFVFVISNLQQSIKIKSSIEEETNLSNKQTIVFDLKKPPYKQKKMLKGNVAEYDNQVYHYLFNDERIINTAKYSGVTDYYHLVENYGEIENVYYIYKRRPLNNLINIIFSDDNVDYSQYAFTEHYIEEHPESLKKEYNNLFKENYILKNYYSETLESNIIIVANYGYDIGIDRNNEMVIITESKSIDFESEDGEYHGIRTGKKGSAWEGKELFVATRVMYFKYTLDEKDYLNDIELDHIDVLIDDKLLDGMI